MQREEALKKSEQMLEEDALRFDAFLKENDEKVQEAIKKAEVEAKAKQDKVRLFITSVGQKLRQSQTFGQVETLVCARLS